MSFPTFTWPDWRKAKPGTRFRDTRNGATGTFVRPSKDRHGGGLVKWDAQPGNPFVDPEKVVNYVTIARDAEPLEPTDLLKRKPRVGDTIRTLAGREYIVRERYTTPGGGRVEFYGVVDAAEQRYPNTIKPAELAGVVRKPKGVKP